MKHPITTIEQSKRLLKLGIDTITADAYWRLNENKYYEPRLGHYEILLDKTDAIPAWSLNNLMYALKTKTSFFGINTENVWYENREAGVGFTECNKHTDTFDNLIDCIVKIGKKNQLNKICFPDKLRPTIQRKFAVGNLIYKKDAPSALFRIDRINESCYISGNMPIPIEEQDQWEQYTERKP